MPDGGRIVCRNGQGMSFRSKLLIWMLVIAIGPMLVLAGFDLVTGKYLGQRLADDRRRIMTREAYELMEAIMSSYTRLLQRDQTVLEQAVAMQAYEVERRLASEPGESAPLFFDADYMVDDAERLPPGTVPSPIHSRPNGAGEREPILVSYDEQVLFLVQGVEETDVAADLSRLSTMPEAYRRVYDINPAQMYWQYTSLETGVHSSYPGHGGYPAEYDPRVRQWYERARDGMLTVEGEQTETAWVLMPEVSTRTVSLAIARPVYRPDGAFAGVTAIDVPLAWLFNELELPQDWSMVSDSMLIAPTGQLGSSGLVDGVDEGGSGAVILARQSADPGQGLVDWRVPAEFEPFVVDDPEQLAKIMDEARSGKPGVHEVQIDGQSYLLAHGGGMVFPVVKVPESAFMAEVNEAEQSVRTQTRRRQMVEVALLALALVLVLIVAWRVSLAVTRPAQALAEAAGLLAEGDYDAQVDVQGKDELAQLGEVFNHVGPQLRERERIKQALSLAMDVQQNLLPDATPVVNGLDIAGHSTYCDETGGDYYDYLDLVELEGDRVAVVVGDVMGHGVAAAMLMATARGILKSRCTAPGGLAELLTHLNGLLVKDTGGSRFMTMLLFTLDAQTGALDWASAGHDPPIVHHPQTPDAAELDGSGLPLGIMEGEVYEPYRCPGLKPGTVVFAATDGVWEMKGSGAFDGQMFGKDRVRAVLEQHHADSAEAINRAIHSELMSFRGDGVPDDDVTYVVVKVV